MNELGKARRAFWERCYVAALPLSPRIVEATYFHNGRALSLHEVAAGEADAALAEWERRWLSDGPQALDVRAPAPEPVEDRPACTACFGYVRVNPCHRCGGCGYEPRSRPPAETLPEVTP